MTRPLDVIVCHIRMIRSRMIRGEGDLEVITDEEWEAVLAAVENHDRRVTELLTANNELLERARKAERNNRDLEAAVAGSVALAARLIEMIREKQDA